MNDFFLFTIPLVVIIIWMETDGVVEYAAKLRIPLPRLKDYWEYKKDNQVYYPDFLSFNVNNFTTRLISCQYCLTVILNILVNLIYCWNHFSPVVLCINILLGWYFYPKFAAILRNA